MIKLDIPLSEEGSDPSIELAEATKSVRLVKVVMHGGMEPSILLPLQIGPLGMKGRGSEARDGHEREARGEGREVYTRHGESDEGRGMRG